MIWHTKWPSGNETHPHYFSVSMGDRDLSIFDVRLLPRQNSDNGRIKDYEIYVSSDSTIWGNPIAVGSFENGGDAKIVTFNQPVNGRFLKLVALSELNGNIWSSLAEIDVKACYVEASSNEEKPMTQLYTYPNPGFNVFSIDVPQDGNYQVYVYSQEGKICYSNKAMVVDNKLSLVTDQWPAGKYVIKLIAENKVEYRLVWVKVM